MTDSPVDVLIKNAHHKSVNKKRLTELKGGLTARYLYDKPLIEYLHDSEQPQFILAARQKAPRFSGGNAPTWSGQSLNGMAMHMITDQRWLMVAGMKGGDGEFSVPIDGLVVTDYSTGHSGHEINILTESYEIKVPIGNMYDSDEVVALVDYIEENGEASEDELRSKQSTQGGGESGGIERPDGVHMIAEGKNGQVALFDEKIRISREDIGVLYKLNQLGKGEKEIRLDNITSIQLKEPSSFSKGYIQFGQSGYSESDDGVVDAVDDENSVLFTQGETDEFLQLRDEIERLQQQSKSSDGTTVTEADPTEQLKNIKELHEAGVLSDEEFEDKKENLLDKI
jgi:hypothetical protein